MAQHQRLNLLLEKVQQNAATREEYQELKALINGDQSGEIIEQINSFHASTGITDQDETYDLLYWTKMVKTILAADKEDEHIHRIPTAAPPHRLRLSVRTKWWAAACIILLLSVGSYLLFFNASSKSQEGGQKSIFADIAAPSINRATITMANGGYIYLDSSGNGTLASLGNVQLVKLADGRIAYSGTTTETVYNTLTNPRGSKVIDMMLADGSHVWLNAGSSITYPIAFIGTERKVQITGEAYFEVNHDPSRPFTVSKGETTVQVLGTHFNVNAFDDEENIKVTLLEGSVRVSRQSAVGSRQSSVIKPGEQAQVGSSIQVVSGVNVDETMAWKNGLFSFNGTDINTIMRQIARWYDIEIEYKKSTGEKFHVEMSRNTNVSNVFKILEATGGVHFKIEGKKVIVEE